MAATEARLRRQPAPFGEALIEPTEDIWTNWGLDSVDSLVHEAGQRRYSGFALDTWHVINANGMGINGDSPTRLVEQLIQSGLVQELHVSLGRTDSKKQGISNVANLKRIYDGTTSPDTSDTSYLTSRMLEVIGEMGWHGRVVTEIPAASLKILHGRQSEGFAATHRRLVANIQYHLR